MTATTVIFDRRSAPSPTEAVLLSVVALLAGSVRYGLIGLSIALLALSLVQLAELPLPPS